MKLNVGLPKVFWAETINTASFIINRSPSSAIDFKIPEEVWSSRPIDYSSLKIFGCPAYVLCRVESVLNWIRSQENVYFLVLKKVLKATGFGIQSQRKR